jgi:hypothetical protein
MNVGLSCLNLSSMCSCDVNWPHAPAPRLTSEPLPVEHATKTNAEPAA